MLPRIGKAIAFVGPFLLWSAVEAVEPRADFEPDRFFASPADRTGRATAAEQLRLPEGFRAELLYTVPLAEEGSWVCLASDPQGRLIASAESGGLFRITPPPLGADAAATRVERLDVDLGGAQGLLWAFNSLYATISAQKSGLYRLRDTDRDDQFDEVRLLRPIEGDGEHGPHGLALSPDGAQIYIVGGNGSNLAEPPERSLVPRVWRPDRLLTRLGESDGRFTLRRPGGWICRTDADGRTFELVAMGLRNPYDLAFNSSGELFTFDSDMEWDAGTPWYRPTRINHVISGADFGWRAGTDKWPDDYLDSFGSVVDVGFSSPTGVAFGTGTRFPPAYQRALLVGDWSLGHIYAVHLEPHGASYKGRFEAFITGAPLPVTDLFACPRDGALYFIVGGRNVTSALYRVTYAGPEPMHPVAGGPDACQDARQMRRTLEAFHGRADAAAVDAAWPFLAHADRSIRHAARVAIEHQPVETWSDRALAEPRPMARLAALAALVRHRQGRRLADAAGSLHELDWRTLTAGDRLDLVRVEMLLLSRAGGGKEFRDAALASLDVRFPSGDVRLDRELSEILTYLKAPALTGRLLHLLETAGPQELQIHYAMCLSQCQDGWTLPERRAYFDWFARAAGSAGGVTFSEYIERIHRDAVQSLTQEHRAALGDSVDLPRPQDPYQLLHRRSLVQRWTTAELAQRLSMQGPGNAERGRAVFSQALCYRCHRFAGLGGMGGPDLTGLANRFSGREIIEAIIEPSRVVSDQYEAVTVVTEDGKTFTGKVADVSGNTLLLKSDLANPADLAMIERDRIEAIEPAAASMMPTGLLDTFTDRQVADLLEFLRAGAEARQP